MPKEENTYRGKTGEERNGVCPVAGFIRSRKRDFVESTGFQKFQHSTDHLPKRKFYKTKIM